MTVGACAAVSSFSHPPLRSASGERGLRARVRGPGPPASRSCRAGSRSGRRSSSVVEFDGSGKLSPRPDWAADAAQNVDAAVAARVTANGGRTFVAADVAHTDVAYGDFRRWSSGALQEIAASSMAAGRRRTGRW